MTIGDVMALIWGMRGLTETTGEVAPATWQRFLDIHLAGLRTSDPVSATPSMSAGQLAGLIPGLDSFRGGLDEMCDLVRVRDHRQVA